MQKPLKMHVGFLAKPILFLLCLFLFSEAWAHPMPSSVVHLSVQENTLQGEAKIPFLELANAVGDDRVKNLNDPFFTSYFEEHIQASSAGKPWKTKIENIRLVTDNDPVIGTYQEVVVSFLLTPPAPQYLRNFTFNYDAVLHQVVTHSALVYVQQDWSNGIQAEEAQQIGVIAMDVPTQKIYPLQINLEKGSWWKGMQSMISLGMRHIKEGTDHLLFLLVLLLPAMLRVNGKRWGEFGGARYSLVRLLKIVTAFTIGHSVTLILGALGWLRMPSQPVEILIAVSILVSAVHAVRPLFPGREIYIAAGFGLIHGLAFATVLANLQLSAGKLALSILGFNLGIEIMQLFVILLVVPWLMLLSNTTGYKWVRTGGGALAGVASAAWVAERVTGKPNGLSSLVEKATQYSLWLIVGLSVGAMVVYLAHTAKHKRKFSS